MLISIFTPTHNSKHLLLPYESLVKQSYPNWEWVLVPNGGLTMGDIPMKIRSDPRVRIMPSDSKGIGALKHFACHRCTGEMYVELDHDDRLTSDALARLRGAWDQTPHAFYYSDFVHRRSDGSCEVFDAGYGWESYPFVYEEERLVALKSFPANARTLSQIYFAPN